MPFLSLLWLCVVEARGGGAVTCLFTVRASPCLTQEGHYIQCPKCMGSLVCYFGQPTTCACGSVIQLAHEQVAPLPSPPQVGVPTQRVGGR